MDFNGFHMILYWLIMEYYGRSWLITFCQPQGGPCLPQELCGGALAFQVSKVAGWKIGKSWGLVGSNRSTEMELSDAILSPDISRNITHQILGIKSKYSIWLVVLSM